jgi:hypothetical protein
LATLRALLCGAERVLPLIDQIRGKAPGMEGNWILLQNERMTKGQNALKNTIERLFYIKMQNSCDFLL